MNVHYNRVLLKLSGEAFAPGDPESAERYPTIDPSRVSQYAREIATAYETCPETGIAIVIGGGNIWRGASGEQSGMDRNDADNMGMLATVINGLALKAALLTQKIDEEHVRVMSAMPINRACEEWIAARANHHLNMRRIIICVAGLGEPNFTTDTAAVQRARNIGADIVLKGTHNVDGIYTSDPNRNSSAQFLNDVTFDEAIEKQYKVMDGTAFTHANEAASETKEKLPIRVFLATHAGNICRAIEGYPIGSLVHA